MASALYVPLPSGNIETETRRAFYHLGLLTMLRKLRYPYFVVGPCDLVVYVPARWYLGMRQYVENHREIGTRVEVLIDQL